MRSKLDEELKLWGYATVGRYDNRPRREDGPGSHPISRARQFAPGTRARAALKLAGRDGHDRRKLMAQGIPSMGKIPMWAADAIRCAETRTHRSGKDEEQASELDRALMDLYRVDQLQGLAVRLQYTTQGSALDRAKKASIALGREITKAQFRDALQRGKAWLSDRLGVSWT